MNNKIEQLKSELEKMYAVELLEYHDKNLLSGDNKSRSEDRQRQLEFTIKVTNEIHASI